MREANNTKLATPSIRNVARHLLALEADRSERADAGVNAAISVFEKLRLHLSKLIGILGFQALLSRALTLATTEAGWLEAVRVEDDATLVGFRETALQQPADVATAGGTVLLAQLLGLLFTFIGAVLTLGLVQSLWPEARLDDRNLGVEQTTA